MENISSEGGRARAAKLSPERRKQIAQSAAKARWGKKKKSKTRKSGTATQSAPRPHRARQRQRRPAEDHLTFSAALVAAEKRLPEAIRDQAEAATRYTMLGAEIAGLQNTIYALRNWQRALTIPGIPGALPPPAFQMPTDPRQVSMQTIMSDAPIPTLQAPQTAVQTAAAMPKVELPFIPGRVGGGALGPSDLGGEVLADNQDEDEHLKASDMNRGSWV